MPPCCCTRYYHHPDLTNQNFPTYCSHRNEIPLTRKSVSFRIPTYLHTSVLRHTSNPTYDSAIMDMDNMLAGAAGGGAMGQFPLEQWFYEMPACTRYWTTATIITSVLVQCHVITPFQLFYSFRAVFVKNQVRLLVNYARHRKLTELKVLATDNHLPLLRPPLPRPPLPRLLPPALLPPP